MLAKRLSLSLLAVGIISLIVTAATFALFSDQTENKSNTFTAGTVKLGTPSAFTCDVHAGGIAPGDTGKCTVSVQYIGSLNAWIGADVSSAGDLFNLDGNHMLITNIKNGAGDILSMVSGKYLVKTAEVAPNETVGVEVDYAFPLAAGNDYQGKQGTISVQIFAVQARNNSLAAPAIGPMAWQ